MQHKRLTSETALSDKIRAIEKRVNNLETQGTGNISFVDEVTGVETVIGDLSEFGEDRTGIKEWVGDTEPPAVPTAPIVSYSLGRVSILWDGAFVDNAPKAPDFHHNNIYGTNGTSTVQVGTISIENEVALFSEAEDNEVWTFWFTSVDANSNESSVSESSIPVTIIPLAEVPAISDAIEALQQADLNLSQQIVLAAGSNSRISHGATEPDPPLNGWKEGDVWFQHSTSDISSPVLAWYTRKDGAWKPQTYSESFLPAVNIGTGTYGSLSGLRLEAKSVRASSLLISSTDNLIEEPDFTAEGQAWDRPLDFTQILPTASRSGGPALRISGTTDAVLITNIDNKFTVDPGSGFRGMVSAKSSEPLTAGAIMMYVRCFDSADNIIDDILIADLTLPEGQTEIPLNTWTTISGMGEVPENTVSAQFYVSTYNATVGSDIFIDFISATRAATGNLVVDGAITALKLAAESVTARALAADSVLAKHVKAGAIEAQHMSIGAVRQKTMEFGADNLIVNPSWEDAELREAYPSSREFTEFNNAPFSLVEDFEHAYSGTWGMHVDVSKSTYWASYYVSGLMPTKPLDKFYLSFKAKRLGATVGLGFQAVFYGVDGQPHPNSPNNSALFTSGYIAAPPTAINGEWVSYDAIQEVPANTFAVTFRLVVLSATGGNTGAWAVDDLEVRKAMSGTSSSGQTMELSPKGLKLYNAEGAEVVSLTSDPPNYLGILDGAGNTLASLSDTGMLTGQSLNLQGDATIMGDNLVGSLADWESPAMYERTGWLDDLARGVIAYGINHVAARSVTNGEYALMEVQFQYFAGRSYRITVEPLSMYVDNGYGFLRIRREYSDQTSARPNLNSPILRQFTVRNIEANSHMYMLGGTFHLDASQTATCKLLLTMGNDGGKATIFGGTTSGSYARIFVEDMGMRVDETGVNRTDKRQESVYSPPPPPPELKNYTKVYQANDSRSYYTSGGHYTYNSSKMYQGNSPAVGGLQSIAKFPSMTGDLSGATITGVRVYLYYNFWYYNSGGTAKIGLHGQTGLPSSKPSITQVVTSSSWPKPGGRWVNIPSQYWNGFKTGQWRGVAIGDGSPSTSEYGYANGTSTRIEIKYKK